jgi:type 1 glutamine amidotransferase
MKVASRPAKYWFGIVDIGAMLPVVSVTRNMWLQATYPSAAFTTAHETVPLEEEKRPMKQRMQRVITGACAIGITLSVGLTAAPVHADDGDYDVLVVGKTLGFRHSHIDDTTRAVIQLGEENGFDVDVWDPAQPTLTLPSTPFTSEEDLSKYATIIFASPVDGTNNLNPTRPRLLNDSELAAFQGYIRSGGGYVGLHAATDSMHTVPWYSELTGGGARFRNHPAQQTATMRVESPTHPSTEMLPTEWVRFDEWYNFSTNPRDDVHVLITLDESTYNPGRNAMGADHPIKWVRFDEWYNYTTNPREDVHVLITLDESTYTGGSMGADHPLAWCHNFEGGRSWYEGAGHTDVTWTDPLFLSHVLGGIEWTAGLTTGGGDCVTFGEVDELLADVGAGSVKDEKLTGDLAEALDAAELAADSGDHDGAIKLLVQAEGKAHGLQDDVLVAKIGDLIEWQEGLAS